MEDIISNKEMASYMNMVFNSKEINDAYRQNPEESANVIFQNIGNMTSKYYISTGDRSLESVKGIIEDYLSHGKEKDFFKKYYMPRIEDRVSQNLGIDSNNLSLKDRVNIQEYVAIRNISNIFYTHCFPGALIDEVSTNGLDISRELFKEEYQTLATRFKTAFKTGELNYCELSAASLSYATRGIPERVSYAIGGVSKSDEDKSIHDTYERSFYKNLKREFDLENIDVATMEKMKQAGTKLIDFYAVGKSGIAFFRDNRQIAKKESEMKKNLSNGFLGFGKGLKNTSFGSIIKSEIEKAKSNPEVAFDIYESLFKKITNIYPDAVKGIKEFVDNILAYNMSQFGIKNFFHGGYADGYRVDSGRMSPNEFAIATFIIPSEIARESQIQDKKIDDNSSTKEINSTNSSIEKLDYVEMQKNIVSLERDFKKVTEMSLRPEMIETVPISKKKQIMVATIDDEKRAVGYKLASKGENENIYYSFNGNVDSRIKNEFYFELEELTSEEKAKIVEKYKESSSEIDEDTIEEDAMSWYVDKKFNSMSEEEKSILRRKELESHGKFSLSTKDEKAVIVQIENGIQSEKYTGEIVYSKDGKGKYNKFFEFIRGEMLQSVDDLGRQVVPEIEDVKTQESLEEIINNKTSEKNTLERGVE